MRDENVVHSLETEIPGMGDVRIRLGETTTWAAPGLMVEVQWKDANGNWLHGRAAPEFPIAALAPMMEAVAVVANGRGVPSRP